MRKVDPISKDEAWDNFVSAINNKKTLEPLSKVISQQGTAKNFTGSINSIQTGI